MPMSPSPALVRPPHQTPAELADALRRLRAVVAGPGMFTAPLDLDALLAEPVQQR